LRRCEAGGMPVYTWRSGVLFSSWGLEHGPIVLA
jgi:hypothetical protein